MKSQFSEVCTLSAMIMQTFTSKENGGTEIGDFQVPSFWLFGSI